MYKQFSYVNFIQTNERNHKLLFNKNEILNKRFDNNKMNLLLSNKKKAEKFVIDIKNTNRRLNWKQSHKRKQYFSKSYYLISKHI